MKEEDDLFLSLEKQDEKKHIYTVSQITRDIKSVLEDTFGQVWVEGEISNFRPAASGHYYFSLKDESALLSAAMFSRVNKEVKFKIEDGLKVICFGSIQVYEPRGQYQIIVERVEPKGIGALQLALEQLKLKLEKEGLFSAAHKKAIPYLPVRIGLVTSGHGAAIKDIFKVLDRRFKDVHIIVNPVRVQGDGAGQEIALAIRDFNQYNLAAGKQDKIDVLIVGRGGGSIEDLWAFNEEIVARAIYDSGIPVISAVGHERDWTISDLVADLRAPTPSAAAELVIPEKEELQIKVFDLLNDLNRVFSGKTDEFVEVIETLRRRLTVEMTHIVELSGSELGAVVKKLPLLNPANLIPQYLERVEDLAKQIFLRIKQYFKIKELGFVKTVEKMSGLNPLNILSRGYSVTFKREDNLVLKDVSAVKAGDSIKTKLFKGELLSTITEVVENG